MVKDQVLDENTKVGFVFWIASTTPNAPANYCAEKLRLHLAQQGSSQADPNQFLQTGATVLSVPVAPKESHHKLSRPIKRQHNARISCALISIEKETPLLDGELIEQDLFSFLTASFLGCPERTAVLWRKTNYGELLYLFEGLTVALSGQLLYQKPALSRSGLPSMRGNAVAMTVTAGGAVKFIAGGIASGMLSAVGGAIAGGILDNLFPPGVPDYFGEVYAQLKLIVSAEIEQGTIDGINGSINNLVLALKTEYTPAKSKMDLKKLEDRQHLYGLLQGYARTFLTGPGGMLGTLMSDKYAQQGFSVFLIGAGLHLSLYQEMANVDPTQLSPGVFPTPLESSYGLPKTGTVASTAQVYSKFVVDTWPKIQLDRQAKIKPGEKSITTYRETPPGCAPAWDTHNYVYFSDDVNLGALRLPNNGDFVIEYEISDKNKDGSYKGPEHVKVNQDYQTYCAQKAAELINTLNNPGVIAQNWQKLAETPIQVG